MNKQTADIVGSLISALTFTGEILEVVDNLDETFTLSVCKTYHAMECVNIDISGTPYKVVSVVNDESITIEATSAPTGTEFQVLAPFYIHGTPRATNSELSRINDWRDKSPLAWLLEILRERYDNDVESSIDRVSEIRLFFLAQTNEKDWKTTDHYVNVIQPMWNLAKSFIDVAEDDNRIAEFDSYEIIPHAKFGIYTDNQGHTARILNDPLSGVELRIDLPIYEQQECCPSC